MAKRPTYEYFDHTADLGIRVRGRTLAALFTNLGKAIFETQIAGKIESKKEKMIKITSDSKEELLIDWCRELLYNFSVHGFIPKRYKIKIKKFSLLARLRGDVFDTRRHKVKLEIKNPTYHNLHIEKTDTAYEATIILDV